LHLVILRRAKVDGYASLSLVRAETRLPRYAISRAAAHLAKRGMGKVVPLKSDKRYARFEINNEGRKMIELIEEFITFSLVYFAPMRGTSKRYFELVMHLHQACRFLPVTRASAMCFPTTIPIDAKTDDHDLNELRRLLSDLSHPDLV
jgi:hypothetical protein